MVNNNFNVMIHRIFYIPLQCKLKEGKQAVISITNNLTFNNRKTSFVDLLNNIATCYMRL